MKILMRILSRVILFGLATWLFPTSVYVKDLKTLVLVAIITSIVEVIGLLLLSFGATYLEGKLNEDNAVLFLVGVIVAILAIEIAELVIAKILVTGFAVNGVVANALIVFSLGLIVLSGVSIKYE